MCDSTESEIIQFEARVSLLGERIDLRGIELPDRLAVDPLAAVITLAVFRQIISDMIGCSGNQAVPDLKPTGRCR